MKFILYCVTLNLSDNLTETPNVKKLNYHMSIPMSGVRTVHTNS